MSGARQLQAAAILVGLLLLSFTAIDWLALVWPLQPGTVEWRYAALSSLSGSLLTPVLAVLLLLGVAVLGEKHRLRQALSLLLLVAGLSLGAACTLLVLDALQVRAGVRPEMLSRFDITAGRSLLKLALGTLVTLALGLLLLRIGRVTGPARGDRRRKRVHEGDLEVPLVVRRAAPGSEMPERPAHRST